MSLGGDRIVLSGLWMVLLANPRGGSPQQAFDPLEGFNANGFDQNRDYFSRLPLERIDPMTGSLSPAIPGSRSSVNAFGAAGLP